jgi:putative transposase
VLSHAQMCRRLSISRSAYCASIDKDASVELRGQIQQVALDWPSYGYRRITSELHRRGVVVNHKLVLRLMREDNLLCLRKKRFLHTTNSAHGLPVYPNLLPETALTGCDQVWQADITYIRLPGEFIYLAVILDSWSRPCIGWALEPYLESELALEALRMALAERRVKPGLIHHSDRGVWTTNTLSS